MAHFVVGKQKIILTCALKQARILFHFSPRTASISENPRFQDFIIWLNQKNMNQKGFVKMILIGAMIIFVAGVGYFAFVRQTPLIIEGPNPTQTQRSESEIISNLKTNWPSIEALIPFRPEHPGTTAWGWPGSVQFIGKNNLIVRFEDGYNPGIAVLNFDNNKFTILETFKNQAEFTLSDWQNLVEKYGDSSYPTGTYTIDLVRNKQIVSFQELTKVPENIFVKNYWEPELTKEIILQVLKDKLMDSECSSTRVVEKYGSCKVEILRLGEGWKVSVTYDGFYDDSVRASKTETIITYKNGEWKSGVIYETQQCWQDRGHQDFSTELCV